jgi:hypothetical protein
VTRFLAGFALASLVWGGLGAYLVVEQGYGPPAEEPEEDAVEIASADDAPADEGATTKARRPRRRRSGTGAATSASDDGSGGGGGGSGSSIAGPFGDAVTGDDLGEGQMRIIDGAGSGGEEQLTGAEIDHAFDGAMPRIRRCFILAATDRDLTGTLVFGLRIAGSGHPTAVNLSGPAVLTTGDAGDCLRTAARAIAFPTFDGPEMVVRYPITLE